MATKSKKNTKKTQITTATINSIIELIKSKWPEYPVTVENLRRPTKEFVLKFYVDCVSSSLQMMAIVARRKEDTPPAYPQHLADEEILYLNLIKHIPPLQDYGFKLGDLYIFDPIRTTTLMQIVMHYLSFADALLENTLLEFTNDVQNRKEDLEQKKARLEDLEEELNQQDYSKLKEENEKQVNEYDIITLQFDKVISIKKEKDRVYEEKERELEKVQEEIDSVEERNLVLEEKEAVLKEQIITEEEYENLKSVHENEKKEEQNMEEEEVDIRNWLKEHKSAIDHIKTCLVELKRLKLNNETSKLSKQRQDLKDAQQSYQYTVKITKGLSESDLQEQFDNLMEEALKLEKDNKNLYERHVLEGKKIALLENSLIENNLKKSELNKAQIEKSLNAINKQENEIKELEEGLDKKQYNMKQTLERVMEQTKMFYNKFGKNI